MLLVDFLVFCILLISTVCLFRFFAVRIPFSFGCLIRSRTLKSHKHLQCTEIKPYVAMPNQTIHRHRSRSLDTHTQNTCTQHRSGNDSCSALAGTVSFCTICCVHREYWRFALRFVNILVVGFLFLSGWFVTALVCVCYYLFFMLVSKKTVLLLYIYLHSSVFMDKIYWAYSFAISLSSCLIRSNSLLLLFFSSHSRSLRL